MLILYFAVGRSIRVSNSILHNTINNCQKVSPSFSHTVNISSWIHLFKNEKFPRNFLRKASRYKATKMFLIISGWLKDKKNQDPKARKFLTNLNDPAKSVHNSKKESHEIHRKRETRRRRRRKLAKGLSIRREKRRRKFLRSSTTATPLFSNSSLISFPRRYIYIYTHVYT